MSRITLPRTTLPRTARRLTGVAAVAAAAVLLTAVPAAAHVEVESDRAQALAENAELTFLAESESGTAGIAQLRVILPEGIAPTDVTYGDGPKGWKFTAEDDGYTVKGPAVKVGGDAEHSIVVRQLPDAEELAFKTLQTYSDGEIDRWIELGETETDAEGHGHGNEAPVLRLKAAAPDAKPVGPSPSETDSAATSPTSAPAPATEEAAASASPRAEAAGADNDDGMSAGIWIGIAAALLLATAAVLFAVRRRGATRQ